MGLELTTDRCPSIMSQKRYPLRHAASKIASIELQTYTWQNKAKIVKQRKFVKHHIMLFLFQTILFTTDEGILEQVSKNDAAYEVEMLSDDEPFDVERPSTADEGDDKVWAEKFKVIVFTLLYIYYTCSDWYSTIQFLN